jgi:CheY-like chemotaxis protein
VRRLCPHCVAPVEDPLTESEAALSRLYQTRPSARPVGCPKCDDEGYLGRLPVTELMQVTPDLIRAILDRKMPFEIHDQARKDGMVTLLESALERVRMGETTLEEVQRVVGGPEAQILAEAAAMTAEPVRVARAAAAPAAPVVVAPAPRPAEAEDPDEAVAHILVVDDDEGNRVLARAVLETHGFQVSEAADGGEALVLLAQGVHVSLMVLDLDMPKLSGRDVLRAVRGSVATAALPVVILTGSSQMDTEFELMDEGADDYVRKPFEARRFISRIKAALRRARAGG